MVTIKEVAKHAKVSTGTVSRVINNSGYVSQESRRKVEEAMKTLNYKPNIMARALNHKKSKIIGLLIPDITNPFFPELTRGVEDTAKKYGYTVMLCNTDQDREEEEKYVEFFKRYYVEGIISASPPTMDSWETLDVPIVLTDRVIDAKYPVVAVDNRKAAKEATEYLINNGLKNIVHIAGSKGVSTSSDRVEGYIDAMTINNLTPVVHYTDFNSEIIKDKAKQFFEDKHIPEALFCANDIIATIFLNFANLYNVKVPGELQIIGFDGIFLSDLLNPSLTTMKQPIYDMGKVACETLIEKLEKDIEPVSKKLNATLKIGGTTL